AARADTRDVRAAGQAEGRSRAACGSGVRSDRRSRDGFGKQAGRSGRRDARDASAGSAQVAAVACVVIFHRHRLTMRRTAINACALINSFPALQ
ncbi:hypothetical protein, partial [Burkholderia sola]|uniref:hypothetical protein n=1 Tax=Burkholderia sola TaxID=2843302 RepID=UPI001C0A86CA